MRRLRHTAVRLSDGRVVVFGGYDLASRTVISALQVGRLLPCGRRIEWTMQETTGVGPGPRCQHVAAMLPDGYTMIVFGGSPRSEAEPGSVFLLDTRTWRWQTRPVAALDRRIGIQSCVLGLAIVDAHRQRLLLFGGAIGDMVVRYLDLVTWTWGVATTPAPADLVPRERSSVVVLGTDHALLVAGGSMDSGMPLTDVWRLHLGTLTWHRVEASCPLETAGHTAQGGLIFGGYTIRAGQLRTQARVMTLQFGKEPFQDHHEDMPGAVGPVQGPKWPWEPPET